MPEVLALVEVKAATTPRYAQKNYRKDVAKLALMGEYYHRHFGHPHPYLGNWILAVDEQAASDEGMAYFRKELTKNPMPGTERVRAVVFRPNRPPEVVLIGMTE
jgi:hypothetical protein